MAQESCAIILPQFIAVCVIALTVASMNQNYHQHTQIITEVDVKLNKWNITIEKLYRKRTETKFKKKL